MSEISTELTTAAGGIMTDEVGTITGDVEISSTCDDSGAASAKVRYCGADEWYAISDCAQKLGDPAELSIYHAGLVGKYNAEQ